MDVRQQKASVSLGFYDVQSEDLSSIGEPIIWLVQISLGVLHLFAEIFAIQKDAGIGSIERRFHQLLKTLPAEFVGRWSDSIEQIELPRKSKSRRKV
jgi:hypothetical protein